MEPPSGAVYFSAALDVFAAFRVHLYSTERSSSGWEDTHCPREEKANERSRAVRPCADYEAISV